MFIWAQLSGLCSPKNQTYLPQNQVLSQNSHLPTKLPPLERSALLIMPPLPVETSVRFDITVKNDPNRTFTGHRFMPADLIRADAKLKEITDPGREQLLRTAINPILLDFHNCILANSNRKCNASPCRTLASEIVSFPIYHLHEVEDPFVSVDVWLYCGNKNCEIKIRQAFDQKIQAEKARLTPFLASQTSTQQ